MNPIFAMGLLVCHRVKQLQQASCRFQDVTKLNTNQASGKQEYASTSSFCQVSMAHPPQHAQHS
jgi:hypothetical protein